MPFAHLRITAGAFPEETEQELGRYLHEVSGIKDKALGGTLRFAAMCVLESVSYTRKDGQYLRWDYRSGRSAGKKQFHKGRIRGFTEAIRAKLEEIASDVRGEGLLFGAGAFPGGQGTIELRVGSCLDVLPDIETNSFDCLVTSPPYCNRYDYTRTYALELAMLGVDEERIRSLRQAMLCCTVENREKKGLGQKSDARCLGEAIAAFESQELLRLIVEYLEKCRDDGSINNSGIPRMVRNYFKELALVIFECRRALRPGAPFIMVNDNVRYQGVHVPVDLILSSIAQEAGFDVEAIWVLPRGKGNSSQQMGLHGRDEIRKCVYVWKAKE